MKNVFKLENLCCANCAAKMEKAINKMDGVEVNIAFMTQKLTVNTERDIEELLPEIQKTVSKIEKDCRIVKK